MKRIVTQIIGTLFLTLSAVHAQAQARRPTPPAELKKLDVWIGSWELSGTARDQPADPEYNLHWQLHEHWILDGFFMQVDQTWEGGGQSTHALELLSYDQGKKIYADSGFGSDGSTWSLTATFRGSTMTERGETLAPDGTTTRCRMTWVFSDDGRSVSGTEECDKSGVRWKAVEVKGTKVEVKGTKSGLPR
jgi:hypothetical protein